MKTDVEHLLNFAIPQPGMEASGQALASGAIVPHNSSSVSDSLS